MSKVVQAFLSGVFFTYFIDFFFFLGIKKNYIDFFEIDLYYNILFADNQNIFIFILLSVIIGYITIYIKSNIITVSIIFTLFLAGASTNIPSVGYTIGEKLFMSKNITYKNLHHTFIGDIYYKGRKEITFYDYDLKRIIFLKYKDLVQ